MNAMAELHSKADLDAHVGENVRITGDALVGGKGGAKISIPGVLVNIEDSGNFPAALGGHLVTVHGRLMRRLKVTHHPTSGPTPQELGGAPGAISYWLEDAYIESPGPIRRVGGEAHTGAGILPAPGTPEAAGSDATEPLRKAITVESKRGAVV